ncbi:MAG TPA: hypothetical protein VMU81_25400 [Acetobacteraceae bacterium]|jgi:hypothetical protein|nr:hypothetical protein [Acetobacteraceae bacterium]
MNLEDFTIGGTFRCGGGLWRCTDIGTRVVVAIRIDLVDVEGSTPELRRTLDREEAASEGWFDGPPYAVAECVFDEYDMEGCALQLDEL